MFLVNEFENHKSKLITKWQLVRLKMLEPIGKYALRNLVQYGRQTWWAAGLLVDAFKESGLEDSFLSCNSRLSEGLSLLFSIEIEWINSFEMSLESGDFPDDLGLDEFVESTAANCKARELSTLRGECLGMENALKLDSGAEFSVLELLVVCKFP